MMNDMARYLGAIYRQDNGASISAIEFNSETYTWDTTAPLKGSNWSKSGNASVQEDTLVTAITQAFYGEATSFALTMNGDTVTFNIVS